MSRSDVLRLECLVWLAMAVAWSAAGEATASQTWTAINTLVAWACWIVAWRRGWRAWRLDREESKR